MENILSIFTKKAKQIHKNYDYSLVEYKNSYTKVKIICPKHGVFEQTPKNHLKWCGCQKCASHIRSGNNLTTEKFIERAVKQHGIKYDYSLVEHVNTKSKVKIICPTHGVFEQAPQHHMSGFECQKCANNFKSFDEFVINCLSVHDGKYDYSLVEYVNTKSKVKIICPTHGVFEQKAMHHYSGAGCPNCKNSRGETKISVFLRENNINFTPQKRFNECRIVYPLPFDFYIPDLNMCIEYDGQQHFKAIETWGGIENLIEIQNRDKIKTDFCNKNNIILHRIKYDDNINNKLKTIFMVN